MTSKLACRTQALYFGAQMKKAEHNAEHSMYVRIIARGWPVLNEVHALILIDWRIGLLSQALLLISLRLKICLRYGILPWMCACLMCVCVP